MNEEGKSGCGPLFLKVVLMWAIFVTGLFVGLAKGSANDAEQDKPMAEQVIRALMEAAEGNDMPVDVSAEQLVYPVDVSGICHLAGLDTEKVLTLDKPDLLDPVPELISLGTYKITAYCACQKCCGKSPDDPRYGITATGTKATQGRTIAADPRVLPYGTVVVINGHEYIVEDCGGAIKGKEIDMYFDSHQEARKWGNQYWEVFTYD